MVRDDQEIQRSLQLYARPVIRMDHRLALGKSVGGIRVGSEIVVEEGIEGIGGVQVCITPEKLPVFGGNAEGEETKAHRMTAVVLMKRTPLCWAYPRHSPRQCWTLAVFDPLPLLRPSHCRRWNARFSVSISTKPATGSRFSTADTTGMCATDHRSSIVLGWLPLPDGKPGLIPD